MASQSDQFFDINFLPKTKGLLVFPISMSRIATGQNPQTCLQFIKHFAPKKISAPNVGVNVVYGDSLYFLSDSPAHELKYTFMHEIAKHKQTLQKLIQKNHLSFQIQHGFHYSTWSELYLNAENFLHHFHAIQKFYQTSTLMQNCISDDAKFSQRDLSQNQINFFLEEHLLFYLMANGKVRLPNDYIQGQEEWILICYPGTALKSQIHLVQKNPLNFHNPQNKYQHHYYNLENKKLYDLLNINLDTWDFS